MSVEVKRNTAHTWLSDSSSERPHIFHYRKRMEEIVISCGDESITIPCSTDEMLELLSRMYEDIENSQLRDT